MNPALDVQAALQRLVDEADVSQVILRYADGIDRRNFDQVWACFASDAEVVGTTLSGPLNEYLPQLLDQVRSFGATQHFIGNQLRSVDGDQAHTETYAIAHHFSDAAGEKEAVVMGVRYVDDLVRKDRDDWVIARRHVDIMWSRRS